VKYIDATPEDLLIDAAVSVTGALRWLHKEDLAFARQALRSAIEELTAAADKMRQPDKSHAKHSPLTLPGGEAVKSLKMADLERLAVKVLGKDAILHVEHEMDGNYSAYAEECICSRRTLDIAVWCKGKQRAMRALAASLRALSEYEPVYPNGTAHGRCT
jgi:hypothetical protein